MLLLVKGFKIYVLKSTKNLIFSLHFLNVDSSFTMKNRILKFSCGCSWQNDGGNRVSVCFLFRP